MLYILRHSPLIICVQFSSSNPHTSCGYIHCLLIISIKAAQDFFLDLLYFNTLLNLLALDHFKSYFTNPGLP